MTDTELVALAKAIAEEAHAGQFRRDGVTPYILHPAKVAALMGDDPILEQVAWLHDVLEDTEMTPEELLKRGVSREAVLTVCDLTHETGSYAGYISRVSHNPLARKVKIADIVANLTDDPTPRQIVKDHAALQQLCG